MQPIKVNIFYIFKLLSEFSDEEHILTTNDILELLLSEYGIQIERRSVYKYINTLMFLGADISVRDDNGKGYYLRSRYIDDEDIRMLIHGLYFDPECDRGAFNRLSRKLQGLLSRYKRREYVCDKPGGAAERNTEKLLRAAAEGERIGFTVTVYRYEDGRMIEEVKRCDADVANVRPVEGAFIAECETDEGRIRLDAAQMRGVSPLGVPSRGGISDEAERGVIIRCAGAAAGRLMEKYGDRTRILTRKRDSFTAVVDVSGDEFYPWAMCSLSSCEVIEPKSLRERIVKAIRGNMYEPTLDEDGI